MEGGVISEVREPARSSLPPGPRAPALVQALRMYRDPLSFAPSLQRRYGDLFTVSLPVLGKAVFVATPEAVKTIFTAPPASLNAGELLEPMAGIILGPNSVLTLDGAAHMRQRKLLLPPVHGERIRRYGESIRKVALEEMESWPVGKPFATLRHFQRITMAVILESIFGIQDSEQARHADMLWHRMKVKGGSLMMAMPALRLNLGPMSPWARFLRARQAIDDFIFGLIESRRGDRQLAKREDVLSILMQARDENGEPMSDAELRDELVSMIVGGFETGAFAMSWTLERILRTPAAHARIKEAVAAGDDEYVDATVRESLRMRPPLVYVMRKLNAPLAVGGYELPAGTVVVPASLALHYREDLFPQPQLFRPERFLEGEAYKYAWTPFGGGVRRCIGAAFAELEMRVTLQTVFAHADLRAADPRPEGGKLEGLMLSPAKGSEVVLERPLR